MNDLIIKENLNTDGLKLNSIIIDEKYSKEWQVNNKDFKMLSFNGKILRNTLYRVGGINFPKIGVDNFFLLIKHVEAFYSKDIMNMSGGKKDRSNKHLESKWVILDRFGNELVEFNPFESPYIIKNSCIYSLNNNYYNIITKELYCSSYSSMSSDEYIFLDNAFDKDTTRRGIMKINKKDGTYEIYKKK